MHAFFASFPSCIANFNVEQKKNKSHSIVTSRLLSADCQTLGRRCTLLKDKCFCVYETADGVEATWLQADSFCRERTGGRLVEMTSRDEEDAVAGIILNTGRYWTGMTSQRRYEYYGKCVSP